jgi:hypothetical protein
MLISLVAMVVPIDTSSENVSCFPKMVELTCALVFLHACTL